VLDRDQHNNRSIVQEASGACGDLGTFIPHVIGAITVAGLAPAGVLFGFGLFLVSTGLFYGLPLGDEGAVDRRPSRRLRAASWLWRP
jgi:hypothetical protein